MKTIPLLDGVTYREGDPLGQPLYIDHAALTGRILRFSMRPGQVMRQHHAPHSPVYIVVLAGHGFFSGGDGKEQLCGPNTLLVFDVGETHGVRADKEDLVFVTFLHGVPEDITH